MVNKPLEGVGVILTGLAVGIGIAFLIIPVVLSGLPGKWNVDPEKSIFLPGGHSQAEKLISPYGLTVLEYGEKYAIVRKEMSFADLKGLGNSDRYFQDALLSREKLVVYRGTQWTVVFVYNHTLSEALTLSRIERIGREFNETTPQGFFVLDEKEVLGKTISRLVNENIIIILLGMFLLYSAVILIRAFIYGKYDKTEETEKKQ